MEEDLYLSSDDESEEMKKVELDREWDELVSRAEKIMGRSWNVNKDLSNSETEDEGEDDLCDERDDNETSSSSDNDSSDSSSDSSDDNSSDSSSDSSDDDSSDSGDDNDSFDPDKIANNLFANTPRNNNLELEITADGKTFSRVFPNMSAEEFKNRHSFIYNENNDETRDRLFLNLLTFPEKKELIEKMLTPILDSEHREKVYRNRLEYDMFLLKVSLPDNTLTFSKIMKKRDFESRCQSYWSEEDLETQNGLWINLACFEEKKKSVEKKLVRILDSKHREEVLKNRELGKKKVCFSDNVEVFEFENSKEEIEARVSTDWRVNFLQNVGGDDEKKEKKVRFSDDVKVVEFENSLEERESRLNSEWRDNFRFRQNLRRIERVIAPILNAEHRERIYIGRG